MILEQILRANQRYLLDVQETNISASSVPSRAVAVVSCIDPRLVEFLEPALGLSRGEATIIKTAGSIVDKEDSDIIRSLVVAVFNQNCKEIVVVGHSDCAMSRINVVDLAEKMKRQGISERVAKSKELGKWLSGFENEADNVLHSVKRIRHCARIPKNIMVHGLLLNIITGAVKHLITI